MKAQQISPKQINIKDFTYELPEDRIAKHPLADRDQSKLLCYQQGEIQDLVFEEIANVLPNDSLLVVNNTKVIQARILIEQEQGKPIEVFLLEPTTGQETSKAMMQKNRAVWICMVGNLKKFKEAFQTINTTKGAVKVSRPEKKGDLFEVVMEWGMDLTFAELIEEIGLMPLPPYLNRAAEESDKIKYQTVYAESLGSVAAPTAGLHFTEKVFEKLKAKGINKTSVSLHVGAGTFKPVKAHQLEDHQMHEEEIAVDLETLHALAGAKFITSVGTTSLRTLETLYWIGVKIDLGKEVDPQQLISQWEPYQLADQTDLDFATAISRIISRLKENELYYIKGKTQLLIAPGYQIRSSQALVTNFHQPDSTLLLLVAAFVGENWRKIYQHALENNYRFLSFGDSSLLFR